MTPIRDLVDYQISCANLTRYDFRERLRARFSDADDIALDRSIDLSLRLWMMIIEVADWSEG